MCCQVIPLVRTLVCFSLGTREKLCSWWSSSWESICALLSWEQNFRNRSTPDIFAIDSSRVL
eukprot:scaffold998_cov411-Prasinococcus_capsulatus_cf.AAC.12